MPNYKRSGFKMKGYSYPGTSPMKGKKADKLAAAEKQADASESLAEFGETKMKKSSSILKKAPLKMDPTKSFTQELGEQAAKAGVDAAIGLGVKALSKGKKKKETKSADQSNFAGIKFGK
tara:strand:+ start:250 stop:609 length:360 start_codon:yes stop_codon:yes gene_type:complete